MKECNETITVYNRSYDDTTGLDVWTPTTIAGVSWFERLDTAITDSGLKSAAKCTVRIPTDATCTKTYVDPLSYTSPSTTYTLTAGDIIIRGACLQCKNPAELKKHHSDMVTILGVTDNRGRPRGKHFKVVCE